MTFTTTSKTLGDALTIIAKVVASKNTLPILDNIVFNVKENELTLTATDIENMITATVYLIKTEGEGEFAVNAKNMMDAVKNLPETLLTFTKEQNGTCVEVTYQNGKFMLPTETTEEFPKMEELRAEETKSFTIEESVLQENIARTVFATAADEIRPVMNGIFFDNRETELGIVASDGHMLVRNKVLTVKAEEDKGGSFILPKKPAQILKNILRHNTTDGVLVSYDGIKVRFLTQNFTMICRLTEGRYPNYNAVIPANNTNILIVDRQTLIAALKRVTPFSNSASCLVRLHMEQGTLQIEAEDYDFAKNASENIVCEYAGETFTIGMKGSTIIEILENIRVEQIEIQLADPSRAALILPTEQPEGQDILMLQMPMLIN